MIKMKLFLVLLIFALMTAACGEQKKAPGATAMTDNKENRVIAAKQYLKIMPPQEMLQDLTNKVLPTLPEKKRALFLKIMGEKSLLETTDRISQDALVKHFTVKELQAMTKFYGTPEGKSINQKFDSYMADVMPAVIKEVVKGLQKAEKEQAPQAPEGKTAPAPPAQPKAAEPIKPQGQVKPAAPPAPPIQPQPQAQPETKAKPAPPAGK